MRNIKNIVLSVLLLLLTKSTVAQNTITKPFTIKAGYLQTDLRGGALDFLSVEGKNKSFE